MSATGWLTGAAAVHRPARAAQAGPLLAVTLARPLAFAALAAFGGLHWVQMVTPAAPGAAVAAVFAALAGAAVSIALARLRAPGRVRAAATLAIGLVALAVALAGARVPAGLLDPRAWDELVAGLGQGLGTVPTVRVPYGGLDEWTRMVLILSGGMLIGAAGLLAFAARSNGRFGFPVAAAVVLAALYAVPVMQTESERPFLAGLAFALLLALFLRLEHVERRSAVLAGVVVAVAALGGLVAAPKLDGARPLLDYEELAQSLSPATSTSYEWNHRYGPLNWPRDGREVLRVKSRERAYWKVTNLTQFDGVGWKQERPLPAAVLDTPLRAEWEHTITVTVRALRSTRFVAAGTALDIVASPRRWLPSGPGLFRTETAGRPLRRGNAYRVRVYTPRPAVRDLRAAGSVYPAELRNRYTTVGLAPGRLAFVPLWGDDGAGMRQRAAVALQSSRHARAHALARRLRARSANQYEFMRAVEGHLSRGFAYSENPPVSRRPLEDFLFATRRGYCQQFSGAMALLLRLGGVPARVSAGFSPGIVDSERREYVVRDIDAHSWVEVYFPDIGWVTRDPTPADSPARAQAADLAGSGGGADAAVALTGGSERALGGSTDVGPAGAPATGSGQGDSPPIAVIGGAAIALLALAALLLGRRRRLTGDAGEESAALAELRRALRRSGHAPQPQVTLDMLARRFAGTGAEGYVRALAAGRFGYGSGRPTPAQRAALRRALGAGLGVRGRMRAWWALPPQPPGRRRSRQRHA